MTAPAIIQDDSERIRSNVAKMQAQNATPAEIEHYLRDIEGLKPSDGLGPETKGDRAMGALAAAYQGMTFGQGDKIIAGIQTALPEKLGGQKGWDYNKNLSDTREVLNNYRERHPEAAETMETAGSGPLFMAGGTAATRVGGRALKAAGGALGRLDTKLIGDAAGNVSPRLKLVVRAGQGLRTVFKRTPPKAEGFLANDMGNVAEAARVMDRSPISPRRAASLEERLAETADRLPDVVKASERYRTESGRLQQGAPQSRFDYFAERMAKRAAEQEAAAAEPTLEDLLGLSLEHIKKGGNMRQMSDVASKLRRP